jgi:hypothetical protein
VPEFLSVYQGVIGAVVGFAASQLVQVWRDHLADKRGIAAERRADARGRRDAKLARVRGAYEIVLAAAWRIQTARLQLVIGAAGETMHHKTERINAIVEPAMKRINEATVRLALEQDTKDVRDAFRAIYLAYAGYVDAMRATPQELEIPERRDRMEAERKKVEYGTTAIEDLITKKLAELETSA